MAKRFIDTELFNDEWFSELSKDGKLLFIYLITNCDNAGISKFNPRLIKFQTGVENLELTLIELDAKIVTLPNKNIWIPAFIKFQYPQFPKSKVMQQVNAIKSLKANGITLEILKKYINIIDSQETVSILSGDSYDNDNGNVYDNGNGNDSNRHRKFKKEESSKIVEITKLFRNGN